MRPYNKHTTYPVVRHTKNTHKTTQEIKQKNDFASTIQFSHNTTPPPATIMITSRQGRKIPQLIVWDTQQPHQAPHPHGYTPHILPRKEVIQPHLPVRLPCYDFVPIANPTFDHSPHHKRWLGHGLRVLPTFMT